MITPRNALGLRRAVSAGLLTGVAALIVATLVAAAGSQELGYDVRAAYLPAAESVRETGTPYVPPELPLMDGQEPYVYPPQLAILLVPLTALPTDAAAFLAFLASLAALMSALWLVGVRDLRCFAALLIWAPGFNALEMANVSAALAFAVALLWRYRAMLWRPAVVLGVAVSMKLFLWPLFVWPLAMRRFRTAGLAIAIGLALTISTWAAIGFDDLAAYPDQLARIPDEDSYSIKALTTSLGGSALAGYLLTSVVGGALIGTTILLGRRGEDFRSLTCALAAGLALTPIVWQHYIVLLAVPLGIARPRFSAIWLLPLLLWASPRAGNGHGLETLLPAIVAALLLTALLTTPRSRVPRRRTARSETELA